MRVKVAKWGNSLGVRLPKAAVDAIGVKPGTDLDLTIENGELRLRSRVKTSAERLKEMLGEMDRLGPQNEPETINWGLDRGSEVIDDDYSRGLIAPGPDGTPVRTDCGLLEPNTGHINAPPRRR